MKKLKFFIFLLLFLFSNVSVFSLDELVLTSFNIQGHGPGSSEHCAGNIRWEKQIIDIINRSGAQIVLLQEVRLVNENSGLMNELAAKLNADNMGWKYVTSVRYSVSPMDLNNAVLYNEKYVKLKKDFYDKSPFNLLAYKFNSNEDHRRYKFIKNNVQILEFFLTERPSETFLVVNAHFPDESEKIVTERQQLEFLYADYKRRKQIIIGGDFNLSRRSLIRGSNFSDGIIDGDQERYGDSWGQKTTLSKNNSRIELANDFDHFIINRNPMFSVSEQMHIVFSTDKAESFESLEIGEYEYENSLEFLSGNKEIPGISDHMPIMIRLKYNGK